MKKRDLSALADQRLMWDDLRKDINGLVNKVGESNIRVVAKELVSKNLIWGRGLFCRAILKSSISSSALAPVLAALVAVVNSKFPDVGYLLLKRILSQTKFAYERDDKVQLLPLAKLLAHLINQRVAHEIVALELLLNLLQSNPTKESIEILVSFVRECGSALHQSTPRGLRSVFERFREILREGNADNGSKFLIEGLFAIRKSRFSSYPAVRPEMDIVEPDDQVTHEISYYCEIDPEMSLDVFQPDSNLINNDEQYDLLKKILRVEEDDDDNNASHLAEEGHETSIEDRTKADLVNLRRTVFLTIMSGVDFEEVGQELLSIPLRHGQEMELCNMLLDCCSQQQTYFRYYAQLAHQLCLLNEVYRENFKKCFAIQYSGIHRLETYQLRNVAKFFAHLLSTDALSWNIMACIHLSEEETNSSSRIFIKILFKELSEQLGILLLNKRLNEPSIKESVAFLFPSDNPRNMQFSIDFFTPIGLGDLTKNLRDCLKSMPCPIEQKLNRVFHSDDHPLRFSDASASSSEPKLLNRHGKRRRTN